MAPSTAQIKASALTRLVKEKKLYAEELQQHKKDLSDLEAQPDKEYEIKVQQRIVDETERLIPTITAKIQSTLKDLKEYYESNKQSLSDDEASLVTTAINAV